MPSHITLADPTDPREVAWKNKPALEKILRCAKNFAGTAYFISGEIMEQARKELPLVLLLPDVVKALKNVKQVLSDNHIFDGEVHEVLTRIAAIEAPPKLKVTDHQKARLIRASLKRKEHPYIRLPGLPRTEVTGAKVAKGWLWMRLDQVWYMVAENEPAPLVRTKPQGKLVKLY